jgi:hypothetical protein
MNNDIPSLWLWISGIFFLFGILVLGASLVVLLKILKIAEEMKPKVESLVTKVEALTEKMDTLADKAEETLASVKHSVDGVGGKAQGIMGAIETITMTVATKFDGLAPIISGALAAYKVFLAMKNRQTKPTVKALPGKKKC